MFIFIATTNATTTLPFVDLTADVSGFLFIFIGQYGKGRKAKISPLALRTQKRQACETDEGCEDEKLITRQGPSSDYRDFCERIILADSVD
jgi:hypothetical protein